MPLPWIVALKVFNEGKSAWCVPKKGGAEYNEVVRIRNRTSPEATEARNVERRAKAMEQLKSLDTRKDIDRKRAERTAVEGVSLPEGMTARQVNTWGSRTDAGGDPPFVRANGDRVFVKLVRRADLGKWELHYLRTAKSEDPIGVDKFTPKEVKQVLSKQAWWKTWMKRYGAQFK
jgi:hypothetical protein